MMRRILATAALSLLATACTVESDDPRHDRFKNAIEHGALVRTCADGLTTVHRYQGRLYIRREPTWSAGGFIAGTEASATPEGLCR